jgi:LacI family transcriptional regulator
MAVTLKDIASATGVSQATVSRVINDDPRISETTKRRVREALDSLGYRGTGRRTRTMGVAFLIADLTRSVHEDVFYNEVLGGVTEYLEPRGYYALVSTSTGRSAGSLPAVVRRVDGVIAGGMNLQDSLVGALARSPVPVVFIGRQRRGDGLNAILSDREEGARLATEHLLSLGRRKLACICGPLNTTVHQDRLAGFRRAIAEAGLVTDERLIRSTSRTAEGGFECAMKLLDATASSGSSPDAIFAADDWIAIGVLRALRRRGFRVPEDVAVVGYNDVPFASLTNPPLTTIHVPRRRLGRLAAKVVLDLIEERNVEEPVQMVVSPYLVVRESTVWQEEDGSGAPILD